MTRRVNVDRIKALAAAAAPDLVVEPDESLNPHNGVFRLVPRENIERFREMGTSARPHYVATVYSRADAEFYKDARAQVPLIVAEVEELRDLLRKIEWSGDTRDEQCCPCCQFLQEGGTHAHDCALAVLLPGAKLSHAPRTGVLVGEQRIFHVGGSKDLFRCDCGCNVFTQMWAHRYKCNSCNAEYTGQEGDADGPSEGD